MELFVRIAVEGEKDVDKTFEKLEDRAQKIDKAFDELPKKVEKQVKAVNKSFQTITKSFDEIQKRQDTWVKSVETGTKKVSSALNGVAKTLDNVQGKVDKLNKSGLTFGAELKGGDDVLSGLDDIADRVQTLKKDSTITLTVKLEGGKETVDQLKEIQGVKSELTGDSEITMTAKVDGGEESVNTLHDIRDALGEIGDNSDIKMNVDTTDVDHARDVVTDTDKKSKDVFDKKHTFDVDAKGAEVLPALLGDINAQLRQFQFIAAGIAAATIPAFIAAAGAAAAAVGVATAGVGALAVGLGEGLVGAAGIAGAAFVEAGAALGALNISAKAAVSNILGLNKSFGSLGLETKYAKDQVKTFTALVGQMPAGTKAAEQAHIRLNEALEYQAKVTEHQIDWWGEYGEAANQAAESIDTIRFNLFEAVSTLGGRMIPTLQEFLDIAESHLPTVDQAFHKMSLGIEDATAELIKFLKSAQGIEVIDELITAIGEAAGPALNILTNGAIVALQALQPLIPVGLEVLDTLSELSHAAGEWAQSAEGMAAINAAWQQMFGYAQQLGEAVVNLAVAGQQVSAAFLSSGLVDFMVQGFVDMTASIRSAAEQANQADSAFQAFLTDAMPILSAAREALGQIVSEALRVVGAITSMRDEATGSLIMVEIFNGIRDAATPLAELLISTFRDLGPIIAELIPNIAQFLQLFLGSTPELAIFLGLTNDLLTAFNALPDSVQIVAARLLTYSLIIRGLTGPTTSLGLGIADLYFKYKLLQALKVETIFSRLAPLLTSAAAGAARLAVAFGSLAVEGLAAVAALGAIPAALLAIAALAVIAIVVYFDTDAFQQAYNDARAGGESAGGAFGAGVIAGLEAVPIVGDVVQWIDENLGQPLDNWINEHGGQFNQAWEAFWAQLGPTAQNSGVKEDIEQIWADISDSSTEKWGEIYNSITGFFTDIFGAVASYLAPMAPDIASIWTDIAGDSNSQWTTIKQYVIDYATEAYNAVADWLAPMAPDIASIWADISGDTDSQWTTIKQYVIDYATEAYNSVATWLAPMYPDIQKIWSDISGDTDSKWTTIQKYVVDACKAMYERVAADLAPMAPEIKKIWDDIDADTGSTWTDSVWPAVKAACAGVAAAVTGTLGPAIQTAIGWLRDLRTEATSVLNMLGSGLTRGERDTPGTTVNPNAGGPTLKARGGIEEQLQGPTGGISDGLHPRVVYGEQDRKVTESYIVWDRPDNVPILAETAAGMGYGLIKMAKGGKQKAKSGDITQTSNGTDGGTGTTPTTGGGTTPTGADPSQLPLVPVPTPTPSELAPYMADAAPVQGYNPVGTPAADWTGADHVNTPVGTVSGDPFGGQGGQVATPWPGLAVIASGGSATAWTERNPSGPSFAMASGGMLPAGGSGAGSGAIPVPLSYQAVPLGTWNQFLGQQWLADPAMDFPVLYPPSGWSPDQIYSPAMMRRGGILRNGTRYFQGGGLNQAQIEAGLAAGSSILGAPYSYGMAGEDGGFDCAGVWNYIESAIAYGTPQIGKRWGTYDAAAGATQFSIPGTTPGGANIGVDTSGWEGDGTHMAGDIQDTAFEGNLFSGVVNGMSSSGFGTQYTMGGAAEVAGMLPSDAGVAPPSTSPAPTMDSTVSDWWGATAPPVPDVTGATGGGGPSASTGGQKINITMNADTGNKQSGGGGGGGKTGNITQTQNVTSGSGSAPSATGASSPASATGAGGAGGGSLTDGVQNWMAGLPGVTEDYLQNVGQQTLGTAGQFSMPPIGNTTDDWIIAALEGMGMDPTPEAIATISSLMMQESGGDPAAVSPDGATGVMQMMPETWAAYNVGGEITDPVANIMASINYQLQRYGGLIDFSPYKEGGIPLSPHFGLVGEAGPEAMIPLSNPRAMTMIRSGMGMDGMDEALTALGSRIDGVREELRTQTKVMPAATGRSMKSGYDGAVMHDPGTGRALSQRRNFDAKRRVFAGV